MEFNKDNNNAEQVNRDKQLEQQQQQDDSKTNENQKMMPAFSQPTMAPKNSASVSTTVIRECSDMDSTASIKTDANFESRLKQQTSDDMVTYKQDSYGNFHGSTVTTTAQMKRQETAYFAKKEEAVEPDASKSTIAKEESSACKELISKESSAQVSEPTKPAATVVKVKPGDRPPIPLERFAVLHMRQPFKILTDIWGVICSYKFRNELFKYLDENMKPFLLEHFDDEDTKVYVQELAKRTAEDLEKWPTMPPVVLPEESVNKEAVVAAVLDNLAFRKSNSDKSLMIGLDTINAQVWNDGYRKKTLRPYVFADVIPNFRKWKAEPLFVKIYTFASGPVEIQKLFLSASTEGDVSQHVTCGFDTRHSFKYDSERFRQVVSSLCERDPKNLFYLTDSPRKGREARKVGITVFVVRRDGNKQYKPRDLDQFPVVDSLDQFNFFEFDAKF